MAAICSAAMLLYAVYLGAFGVTLPVVSAEFGLGTAASGRFFPANFGGFVAGVLISGVASDRWGRKTLLLIGIGLYALGLTLFVQATTLALALLSAALVGAGSGAMMTVGSALASDIYPERRVTVLNAMNIAFGFGAAGGPLLASRLMAEGVGWRAFYSGLAGANALLFVALAMQRVPVSASQPLPSQTKAGETAETRRATLRRPPFLLLCLAQALYAGTEVGFFTRLPTYFRAQFPGGAAWEGSIVTVFWFAMTIGRFALEPLLRRVPLLRLNRVLAIGAGSAILLTLASSSPALAVLGVALTGLFLSGILVIHFSETGNRFPNAAGMVFSGVVASGGVGASLLPWAVSGLAATSLGWRGGLSLLALAALSITFVSLWLERQPINHNVD